MSLKHCPLGMQSTILFGHNSVLEQNQTQPIKMNLFNKFMWLYLLEQFLFYLNKNSK